MRTKESPSGVMSYDHFQRHEWNKRKEQCKSDASRYRSLSSTEDLYEASDERNTVVKSLTTKRSGETTNWRIRAAEAQQITRVPPRRHSLNCEIDKQSTIDCGSTPSQWLDLFREKYRSWSSSWTSSNGAANCERSVISRFLNPDTKTTKTVYLIRHGTAYCNVCRFTHWMKDQRLTPRGWKQVAMLRTHLTRIPQPEVVFTSTLSRAMETAVGAFGAPCDRRVKQNKQSLLMAPQQTVCNLQTGCPGVSTGVNTPPIIAIEDCRERLGDGVVPNQRRKLSEAKRQFPGIDFSLIHHEEDALFEKFDRPGGETEEDMIHRTKRLMQFLLKRPESRIAVVSHGHFLSYLLNLQNHGEEFCNAELRQYQLSSTSWMPVATGYCFKPFFGTHFEM
eukprot:g7016.t1